MTNEEAKYIIRIMLEIGGSDGFNYKEIEALEVAIKALEQAVALEQFASISISDVEVMPKNNVLQIIDKYKVESEEEE